MTWILSRWTINLTLNASWTSYREIGHLSSNSMTFTIQSHAIRRRRKGKFSNKLIDIQCFFFYPLVLVPVPIQLGKMTSKSNKLGICYHCICNLYKPNEQKIKSINKKYSCLYIVSSLSSTFFDSIYCCETFLLDMCFRELSIWYRK
jgi:hypothetical protein